MHTDAPRSAFGTATLVHLAAEHGMSIAPCLRGSGITPVMLDDPHTEILASQELQVVLNVVAALGDVPGLGLSAGLRYDLTNNGIWSFAVISSPTIRHAWRIGVDYMDLGYSLANWQLTETDTEAVATFDYSDVPAAARTFLLERDIASVATLDREVFGTLIAPEGVELACRAPDYAERYTELLTFSPVFDSPANRIILTSAQLDLPMPQGNRYVAALAERQAAAMLQRRQERRGIGVHVRTALLTRGVSASQDQIAAHLRMSARTLRRRLDDDGTSYRELVSETQQMLAEELLVIGATVEDVAGRLGFADASSFTHAFTRWTGTTPGRYARTHR